MDDAVLVWLYSADTIELDEIILKNNPQKFVNDVRFFDDVDECIQDLLSICEEKVFVRLEYGLSYLVNILNDFNQIRYIYLSEPTKYKDTSKIRGVFKNDVQLFYQLEKDINVWKNSQVYLTFCDADVIRMETTTQNVQSDPARFMWSQILFEYLLEIPPPENNPHRDLLEEARRIYHNDQRALTQIDNFEREYTANDAIKWYTGNSFVYRLVNKALRTRDIGLIFRFRFLIQDIYKQLKDEHKKALADIQLPITLYRGQLMSIDEFNQLQINTNQFISVNTFLSTTKYRQVAEFLIEGGSLNSDLIPVVFEILIDSTCDVSRLPPFADITNLSVMKDENEILISMGTVMQLTSVTKINSTIGIVHLRMCQYDDPSLAQMKGYFCKDIKKLHLIKSSHVDQVANILYSMGEYKKAEQILNMLPVDEDSIRNTLRSTLTFSSRVSQQLLVTEDPQTYLESQLPNINNLLQDLSNIPIFSDSCRSIIRCAYDHFTLYKKFIENDELSIELCQAMEQNLETLVTSSLSELPSMHPDLIWLYIVRGQITAMLGRHVQAMNYYDKALAECKNSLDKTHPFYTGLLGLMVFSCMKINDDTRAEELIQQFASRQSPLYLSSIDTLQISARFFEKREDWQSAIACYKDILEIPQLSPNSQIAVKAHMNIGNAFRKLGYLDAALTSCQTAHNLQLQHQPLDHPLTNKLQEIIKNTQELLLAYGFD